MSGLGGFTIDLTDADYNIDDNSVTVRRKNSTTHYRLPRKRSRISVHEFEQGRGRLEIGGFTGIAVTVLGPLEVVRRLRDAVL